jgi:hypothetical protein
MGELRQATDAEVMDWAAAKYPEDHSGDVVITDLQDAASLVGQAGEQVHEHGATHLITQIAVWPFPAVAEALITLDLPSGIRLCTLCISHKHLIPDHTQAAGAAAVIRHVLANVLSAARALASEYQTETARRAAHQPAEVWVVRHDDNHGDDVSLYATRTDGLGALAQTVRSRWDNITGEPGVPATGDALDDEAAVEMYFRHRSGSESYSLYSEAVDVTSIRQDDPADAADTREQQDTCRCGEPIGLYNGDWLHLYNPELTGASDHDASPT